MDEVVCIGFVVVSGLYLNVEVILMVVINMYVDVIYLGYGFLVENVDFVVMCVECGIVWIGL